MEHRLLIKQQIHVMKIVHITYKMLLIYVQKLVNHHIVITIHNLEEHNVFNNVKQLCFNTHRMVSVSNNVIMIKDMQYNKIHFSVMINVIGIYLIH